MLDTRVSDLTIAEFKALVREVVEETLVEILADPDEGLELTNDIKNLLRKSLKSIKENGAVYEAEDVARRLGLEG
jgi:hypothetical protein